MDQAPDIANNYNDEVGSNFDGFKKRTVLKNISPLILVLIVIFGIFFVFEKFDLFKKTGLSKRPQKQNIVELVKFSDESDFKNYYQESNSTLANLGSGLNVHMDTLVAQEPSLITPNATGLESAEKSLDRVSQTNVQVLDIDEPDILKTDGKNIYYSQNTQIFYDTPVSSTQVKEIGALREPEFGTDIISAYPPNKISKIQTIDEGGELLLGDNILIIVKTGSLLGYDIANPEEPNKIWEYKTQEGVVIDSVRNYKDKILILGRKFVNQSSPCPIPLLLGESELSIPCDSILRPQNPIPFDSTYTLVSIDSKNGEILKDISFVGSSSTSVSYFSKDNVYVSYTNYGNMFDFMYGFFSEDGKDLVDNNFRNRLSQIKSLDISMQAKITEFEVLMQNYFSSLSEANLLKLENNMQNLLSDYSLKHARELENSTIVKIGIGDFEIKSYGALPGKPLNQFSFDEYDSHLRVASTIAAVGLSESLNDIYVFDDNLNQVGSVLDLAKGERIYSVRFVNDMGYIVTFKQIDPFFVADLKDPKNPKVVGELKIPGYSSYLDPLSDNLILGVGMEDQFVKLSLFDVSNPQEPKEQSKYQMREYWSEVNSNHHAFLLDSKHNLFFIPAGQSGYIFSYNDENIVLEKVITGSDFKRALYINDYLYVVSKDKIVVIDENNFNDVSSFDF